MQAFFAIVALISAVIWAFYLVFWWKDVFTKRYTRMVLIFASIIFVVALILSFVFVALLPEANLECYSTDVIRGKKECVKGSVG